MKRAALALGTAIAAVALGAAPACGGGQTANVGLNEPLQVAGAQFISGVMPGTPPRDGGPTQSDAGADGGSGLSPLTVSTVLFTTSAFIVSGFGSTGVSGLVSSDTVAVGVQMANQGTGYWVVPAGGLDVTVAGTRDVNFSVGFNRTDSPGFTDLRVVAIDQAGNGGIQFNAPICIESRIPDNGHACSESKTPPAVPAAVFTLTWDTPFDVDLTVITPDGRNVNPKTDPTTAALPDGGPYPIPAPYSVGLFDGATGVIDRDSMGECVVDGWRQEDLVFQDYPPTGTYLIYADPFESCGQPAVRFTLTIYEPGSDGNLHATFTSSGELLANQTTGGASPDGGSVAGLFIAQKEFL